MSEPGFQLSYLRDSRLAPLATSGLPAWLWSIDATRIFWANALGAAAFGAPTSTAIGSHRFDTDHPVAAQIARLAATLSPGAAARLQRLHGLDGGFGHSLTCACSHIVLADHAAAILVVAVERAGPDLLLGERTVRLLAGAKEPIAAFATGGELLAATESAHAHLRGAASLAALAAEALAAEALASRHAAGSCDGRQISIDRVGSDTATVLIASFDVAAVETDLAPRPQPSKAAVPPLGPASLPEAPAERRHPLRFVWQMDEEGRFTLGSDEFITLMGPRTAAALGRRWPETAAALGLDPGDEVARAVATHETWSGLLLSWPVDGSAERFAVELSGLPVFDRDRIFRGYRGFGVCRDVARLTDLAGGHHSGAGTGEQLAPSEFAAADLAPPAENVVPFPVAAEPNAPALSPIERIAFRELSRKLTQRLTAGIEHEDAQAVPPPDPDAAGPQAQRPDLMPDAQPILDRLAVGVVIYRFDQILYANPALLQWTGHQTLEGLLRAGGLGDAFTGSIGLAAAGGDRLSRLAIGRNDSKTSIEGELIDIHWQGEPALAFVSASPVAKPAKPTPARADPAELNAILDAATDGVVVLDRQGLIVYANRSAEALFGYESCELVGRAFAELFVPDSVEAAYNCLDRLAGDGVVASLLNGGEVVGLARRGGQIPLFMTTGRIDDGTDKLCAVFRDITQWKKAEKELTQAKRQAETASSAKSDFLARISHEIRTPLNAIIGFSEVMTDERFGPIGNERYREYLRDIHAAGGHLLSLINDLLDLSKIEAGKLELTFTSVALSELTQQCVAIMQPQANRGRIIMRTSLAPALPQIVADARSMRQILLNLLSNSIKFTGAGGQVIVSTALNDNGEVVLRVRDTGVGMSEQELVTAIEPFRQLATSASAGGTGLGLPLTKALAEANRASFCIKSAPKAGTLVEIAFPASRVLAA